MTGIQHAPVKQKPIHARIAEHYLGFPFDLEARKSSLKFNRKSKQQGNLAGKENGREM